MKKKWAAPGLFALLVLTAGLVVYADNDVIPSKMIMRSMPILDIENPSSHFPSGFVPFPSG